MKCARCSQKPKNRCNKEGFDCTGGKLDHSAYALEEKGETVMKKNVLLLLVAFLLAAAPQALAKTVSGVITMDLDLTSQPLDQEARLWLPYPVSDANQDITDVKISGNYAEAAVYTDKVFKTPMLFARWDKNATSRLLSLSFAASRNEVIRRDFPAKEAAWDPRDYTLYLAPTSLAPFNDQITSLAAKITKGKQGVLAKARAVYDWTVDNTYRNPDTRGCGKGDVCKLSAESGRQVCRYQLGLRSPGAGRRGADPRGLRYPHGQETDPGHLHLAALLGRILPARLRLGAGRSGRCQKEDAGGKTATERSQDQGVPGILLGRHRCLPHQTFAGEET